MSGIQYHDATLSVKSQYLFENLVQSWVKSSTMTELHKVRYFAQRKLRNQLLPSLNVPFPFAFKHFYTNIFVISLTFCNSAPWCHPLMSNIFPKFRFGADTDADIFAWPKLSPVLYFQILATRGKYFVYFHCVRVLIALMMVGSIPLFCFWLFFTRIYPSHPWHFAYSLCIFIV